MVWYIIVGLELGQMVVVIWLVLTIFSHLVESWNVSMPVLWFYSIDAFYHKATLHGTSCVVLQGLSSAQCYLSISVILWCSIFSGYAWKSLGNRQDSENVVVERTGWPFEDLWVLLSRQPPCSCRNYRSTHSDSDMFRPTIRPSCSWICCFSRLHCLSSGMIFCSSTSCCRIFITWPQCPESRKIDSILSVLYDLDFVLF